MSVRLSLTGFALPLLFAAGCATLPDGTATPKLARLSSDEMTRLAADAPRLSPDDLLALAKAGAKPEAIVERFRQSATRFDLTPGQVVDLHQRGLPLPVLEAIHEQREKALRADFAQLLVEREQKCSAAVAQARDDERLRARPGVDPFWPGPFCRPAPFWGW